MEVVTFGLGDQHARRRYDALFNACPDACIQQSTYWAEAIQDIGPDKLIFLLASRGGEAIAGLPLYLFNGSAGAILTSVPQAGPLGGIFARPSVAREEAYEALIAEAVRIAQSRQCLTLTIISNPFDNDVDLYERYLLPDLVYENFTQVLELERLALGSEWKLPSNSKRNIRKAIAARLVSKLAETSEEFERWYEIHERRHRELKLTPLPYELLRNIRTVLSPRKQCFLQLVMSGEEIAAGCFFVHHRNICDVFIMAMNSDYATRAPNYLLVEQALNTMSERGVRLMNWQSSQRRGDGVYKFKEQWGSEEHPYYFLTRLFCDRTKLISLGADGVRASYPGHYVAPFGAFDCDFSQRRFRKP